MSDFRCDICKQLAVGYGLGLEKAKDYPKPTIHCGQELTQAKQSLAQEHDNFLSAHRDNLALSARNVELKDAFAQEKERADRAHGTIIEHGLLKNQVKGQIRFIERYARHHGDCNFYAVKIEGVQPDGGVCKCGYEHDMAHMASPDWYEWADLLKRLEDAEAFGKAETGRAERLMVRQEGLEQHIEVLEGALGNAKILLEDLQWIEEPEVGSRWCNICMSGRPTHDANCGIYLWLKDISSLLNSPGVGKGEQI